jgi:hypothetical protein
MMIGRETEVLWGNLPQFHFVHHKSHMTWPGANPGRRGGKPATNRFSYGTAPTIRLYILCTTDNNTVKEAYTVKK